MLTSKLILLNFKLKNKGTREGISTTEAESAHQVSRPDLLHYLPTVRYVLLHCETIQLIVYYSLLDNTVHIVQCEGPLARSVIFYIYIYIYIFIYKAATQMYDLLVSIDHLKFSKSEQRSAALRHV